MKKTKVMIIDDDKEFLDELEDALTLNNYEVIATDDAISAPDIAGRSRPDVILLDLKMPKKSGLDLALELKQIPELAQVPIIAMSAFYKEGPFSIMQVHGVTKCLSKPLDPDTVFSEIEKVLGEAK